MGVSEGRRREVEAWGVTYERFALECEIARIVRRLGVTSVLELPAHGAKAMPSIYSLGFALAGAKVTLANGRRDYLECWERLGLRERVEFVDVPDLHSTGLQDAGWDLVWDFAYVPLDPEPDAMVAEMKRLASRYVALFSVNAGNVGFHWHRYLHRAKGIPWTHGDVRYNRRGEVARLLERGGLRVVRKGFADCPVWPDSLGFRDMRLHRENVTFDNVDWESPYVEDRRSDSFATWIKAVYAWERIPSPAFLKTLYAHIGYVVGEKT